MAFDPDAYLASKSAPAGGGFDPDAYLRAKGPRAPVNLKPRQYTDEQLGIDAGPIRGALLTSGELRHPQSGQKLPVPMFPGPQDVGGTPEWYGGQWTNNPEEAGDTMVQAGLLGHGAGVTAGTALRGLGVPAGLARPVAAGVEGGVAAKTSGGSFASGAALGGGLAALGPLARLVGGGRNVAKDITRGATKAPPRLTGEVKAAAEGGSLDDVLGQLPQADRAVRVKARTNPGAAAQDVGGVIKELADANTEVYKAIQAQGGGVPVSNLAQRYAAIEKQFHDAGRGVAEDAVARLRNDLVSRYGHDGKLTATQLRNMRNDMRAIADPQRALEPNTRTQAVSGARGELNAEIADAASRTPGVDVAALKARDKQIATLIPVRNALRKRAESQADLSLWQRAKSAPGNAFRRGARELDYALGGLPASSPTAAGLVAGQPSLMERLVELQRMRDEQQRQQAGLLLGN